MWIRRLSELGIVAVLVAAGEAHAAPPPAPAGSSQEEPLEQYRERFKAGMDHYRAGELAEAVGYWEPIYRELGEQKGYRLAYNLGVAYAELGDSTRAAERLQAFVAQVDARRGRAESLAVIVQKEEADARGRIASFAATKGRIQIEAGVPPRAVQVDAGEPRLAGFVAWVAPGEHTITFAPGTPDALAKHVTVRAGETVEVYPSAPAPSPPSSPPSQPPASTSGVLPGGTAPPPAPSLVRRDTERPFSPALFAVSGTLALAAGIAAVPLEENAWALNSRLKNVFATNMSISPADRQSFSDARAWAYAAVGAAIGLGVLTAGLATWYFVGTSQRELVITPTAVSGRF
jgi:hypothetical protein